MKRARGETKRLLSGIMKIQGLIGEAKSSHDDDRDPNGFEKGQKALEEAFNECIELTADYVPVEVRDAV